MSGECDKCSEHSLDCKCLKFEIKAPEGCMFGECKLCGNPFVYDGTSENCLWCEINKQHEDFNEHTECQIDKCEHVWETLGDEQIVDFGGPVWQIRNYTCKKCYDIKQTRSRFR